MITSAGVALAGTPATVPPHRVTPYSTSIRPDGVSQDRRCGAFGTFRFVEDVAISESNPKTGKLVAMALVKAIRNLASPLVIGA